MSSSNKELYDALIEGDTSKERATEAARSVQESSQTERLKNIDKHLVLVETRLGAINRLLWIVIAGTAGILKESP